MLSIVEIEAADHIDSVQDMLAENWAETGFDFDLDLNTAMIVDLQRLGILFALGAFYDGQLIGYSTAMVAPHPYNPAIVCCNSDALFVRKAWRHTSAGARLVVATELAAAARGANRMLWHTRAGTPFAATLQRRDYEPADIIVMKRI